MAVISLESLPVGFRFRPKDEELINYYLKSKISGCRENNIDVIPEVDVCKCEPWDLPAKSMIKTADQEWFFFSPRNRKYPTGRRSNRATEAGYWKATGKDRDIKSRVAAGDAVIGKKKTLVFHKGRAPNGEKTAWIMHEYRISNSTSEKEIDSAGGDEGAYVLCRLFKQQEENSPSQNCDEVEDSGPSPTPTRSSPGDTQHAEETAEMSEIPSNLEVIDQDVQVGLSPCPAFGMQQDRTQKWHVNEAESAATCHLKPEESNCNSNMASDFGDCEGEVGEEIRSLLKVLEECPQSEPIESDGFPISNSLLSMGDTYDYIPQLGGQVGLHGLDMAEVDVSEFLDSILNHDDYSSGGFDDYKDLGVSPNDTSMPQGVCLWDTASGRDTGSNSDADSELVIPERQARGGNLDAEVSEWLYKQSLPSQSLHNSLHRSRAIGHAFDNTYRMGHVGQFVGDRTRLHVSSMNSAMESNIDSFGRSNTEEISLKNNDGVEGTGIKIRPRQPQFAGPLPTWQQGTAVRRIRLRVNLQAESVCSNGSETSSSLVDHEVCSVSSEEEAMEKHSTQHVTKEDEHFQPASVDNAENHIPDGTQLLDATPSEIIEESKLGFRLRRLNDKEGNESYHPLKWRPRLSATHICSVAYMPLPLIFSVLLTAVAWNFFGH